MLLWLLLLLKAQTVGLEVLTQPEVRVAAGGDGRLSCSLAGPSDDVVQVTWQRQRAGDWDNVATHSDFHGFNVLPPYVNQVAFDEHTRLWNSSMVIRNVSLEEGACYRCLFSGHPDGTLSARTCLVVTEPQQSTSLTPDPSPTPTPTPTPTGGNDVQTWRVRIASVVAVVLALALGAIVVVVTCLRKKSESNR